MSQTDSGARRSFWFLASEHMGGWVGFGLLGGGSGAGWGG